MSKSANIRTSSEIREAFLSFFERHDHKRVVSSSLVPGNDPTLLFTNAGMVQFKDVFLGRDKRNYTRATTAQRCVRAGGKHNDLENVGYTARHHTFFEMMGNFSFGDYFKREAIQFCWEFLTEVLKIPAEKLWVTIYEEDDEAEKIWINEIGIDPKRFGRIGAKDNFWSMGDTGPCGPCSEVFYDHGPEVAGGPPGSPDEEGDRYIEIWNLVFMQYDRDSDGNLNPLPKPSVDTGMGLERVAAILQDVHSNYEIDLFQKLIQQAAKATACKDIQNKSLRVIADHIRSCSFLITDGVIPSNEGRGYVLRRIIRRAARHAYKLGQTKPFFYTLVDGLCNLMGEAYPELVNTQMHITKVLQTEEKRFGETLEKGMKILEVYLTDSKKSGGGKKIDGEFAFKLYDTYGFPIDLTADIARERGLKIDHKGFDKAMQKQQEGSRKGGKFSVDYTDRITLDTVTEFTGYDCTQQKTKIIALFHEGEKVTSLTQDQVGVVVLEQTPFYAESGGQVGDQGIIQQKYNEFQVQDTQKQAGGLILHIGRVGKGTISEKKVCEAQVTSSQRRAIALNHTATHLMHSALCHVLGDHVSQKGSLVDDERLRFDFAHHEPVTDEQIAQIENLVNEQIRLNSSVETQLMSYDDAVTSGAMALFGEKYGDEVRVLRVGDYSVELCGGTHAERAGDIGLFKITLETGTASGVRRIEAVTGTGAINYIQQQQQQLNEVAAIVKGSPSLAAQKVAQLLERNRSLEKEMAQLKSRLASNQGNELMDKAVAVGDMKVLAARLDGVDPKSLRDMVDQLKNKLGAAAVVLAAVNGEKVSLVAGVTKAQTKQIKAGDLVNVVATKVGGKGGGRPDMAQAGGNDPSGLDAALATVTEWVEQKLGN